MKTAKSVREAIIAIVRAKKIIKEAEAYLRSTIK